MSHYLLVQMAYTFDFAGGRDGEAGAGWFLGWRRCFKTESIRKMSNFNFQWTKTLYQNNLNNIAFFFGFFKAYRCNWLSNTKENFLMRTRENKMSNFTKCRLAHVIFRILPVFSLQFLWNLIFIFSGSHEK